VLLMLVLLLGGWTLYSDVFYSWRTGTNAAKLQLWSDAHLTLPDMDDGTEGIIPYAWLSRDAVSGRVEFTQTHDPKRVNRLVAADNETMLSLLGPSRIVGLANAGDHAVLVLTSEDMQQGLRLGLDADDQPFFDVIRDGEVTSLLETMASGARVESSAADSHP
jgi:hypothetical protein